MHLGWCTPCSFVLRVPRIPAACCGGSPRPSLRAGCQANSQDPGRGGNANPGSRHSGQQDDSRGKARHEAQTPGVQSVEGRRYLYHEAMRQWVDVEGHLQGSNWQARAVQLDCRGVDYLRDVESQPRPRSTIVVTSASNALVHPLGEANVATFTTLIIDDG